MPAPPTSVGQQQTGDAKKDEVAEFEFPPPPTEMGKTTESITKQTVTEKIITRVTNNEYGRYPIIIEVIVRISTIASYI